MSVSVHGYAFYVGHYTLYAIIISLLFLWVDQIANLSAAVQIFGKKSFRPLSSTTSIDAAYCYRSSSVVCQSVCLSQ